MAEKPILFSAPMVRALIEGRKTQTRRIVKSPWKKLQIVNLKEHGDGSAYSGAYNDPDSWGYPFAEDGACDMSLTNWPELLKYQKGDRLWVRESVTRFDKGTCDQWIWYRAGRNFFDVVQSDIHWIRDKFPAQHEDEPWEATEGPGGGAPYNVPSIFMPRWASRLTLTVTDVRVQRLQDISDDDAVAEGARHFPDIPDPHPFKQGCRWSMETPMTTEQCLGSPRFAFANYWNAINGADAWWKNTWVTAYTLSVERRNIDAGKCQ